MDIGKAMLSHIPPPVTNVKAANEGKIVVNDDKLLVVGPVEGHIAHVLEHVVVWMTKDVNIAMAWGALRT